MKRLFLAGLMVAAMGLAARSNAAGGCRNCDCPTCKPCPTYKPNVFQRCVSLFHVKHCHDCGTACGPFHHCAGLLHHHRAPVVEDMGFGGGPPVGQVTYPYYTNRGPRDFLDPNPPGIGP